MTAAVTDAVIAELRGTVPADAIEVGPLQQRQWSWHASVRAGEHRMLLKVPRWPEALTLDAVIDAGAQPAARDEYAMLERLVSVTGHAADLAAVRPVAFLEGMSGILMEWFDGVRLRRLARPLRPRSRTDEVFRRVGRLLQAVHELSEPGREPFDAASVRADLSAVVERRTGRLTASALRLAATVEGLDGTSEPVGTIHGDLNLDNVLVDSEGRPALIDPNPDRAPLLADLSKLVGDLELDRAQLLTRGRWRAERRRRRWSTDVLGALAEEPLRPVRQAIEIIDRWERLLDRRARRGRSLGPWVEPQLAGAVNRRVDAVVG